MELKKVAVYKFAELEESAKVKAVAYFAQHSDYPYFSEAHASIEAFVRAFHGHILDYRIGSDVFRSFVKTTLDESYFSDIELSECDRDRMPTGYCLDTILWATFYDELKKTGDAFNAFQEAIHSALCDIDSDVEYHYSREHIEELIEINDYDFEADGSLFSSRVYEEELA